MGTDRPLLVGGDINKQADWLNQESPCVHAGECQTADQLSSLKKQALQDIAAKIGAVPTADRRFKSSWVQAILDSQVAIVPVAAELDAVLKDRDFVAEENTIIGQINILSDALNFAILSDSYSPECPDIRHLEEEVDALNQQLQEIADAHREYIHSLCATESIVDIWWQSDTNGAVSIDGGQTYRCFRVLDMLSSPVIKLISSRKTEIDSRWATTKNNRYIWAIFDAIPAHIKQIASEIWENGEIVDYSGENDEPPNRGDNGRGRVESEWIEF